MENKALYFPSSDFSILQYVCLPKHFICGIKINNKLVAFSTVFFKKGIYLIEDTVVAKKYWGNGMQIKMWLYILSSTPSGSILMCTIHPSNRYSLNNAIALGFRIIDKQIMYNNVERYILLHTKQ